jgi:tight adherence protein B
LAEGLDNLAKILRQREVTLAKIKAASSEARTSAWIIGSIPVIVLGANYLFAPKSIEPLFVTSAGNLLLLGSLVWMVMGVFVMYSMVKIGD